MVEHDVYVKSVWLLVKLQKYNIIPLGDEPVSDIVTKYGGFDKVPSIHDFINEDMQNDEKFKYNLDIQSIKVNSKKNPPKSVSILNKYLLKIHNIEFNI